MIGSGCSSSKDRNRSSAKIIPAILSKRSSRETEKRSRSRARASVSSLKVTPLGVRIDDAGHQPAESLRCDPTPAFALPEAPACLSPAPSACGFRDNRQERFQVAHQRYFVNNDQMVEALRCESFQSPVRCTPVAAVHQAHPATPNPQVLELLREVATEDPVTGHVADTAARCPKEMPRAVAGPSIPRSDAPSPPHAGSGGDRVPAPGTRKEFETV